MGQRTSTEMRSGFPELPEPATWVDRFGDQLYRYALARLRTPHEAEEAVQDALLAALQSRETFSRRSQPLSWLIGILRHKVQERMRRMGQQGGNPDVDDLHRWFDGRGKWRRVPAVWDDPATLAEQDEFWQVVRRCLSKLPAKMGEAFLQRTLDDRAAKDVCRDLSISNANLWVLLHRARLRMVSCLERNWFTAETPP